MEQQRRAAMEATRHHDSHRAYFDRYTQPHHYYSTCNLPNTVSNTSSRAPSRTPSLSPPTRRQSSASYSSVDTYASTSSPASFTSSYTTPGCEEVPVQIQQYDSHHLPSIVSVPSMPVLHGHPHGLPLDQTDHHPAKKMKSSSNFFSKFLPTTLTRPVY